MALAGNRANAKAYERQNEVSQVRGGKVPVSLIGKKALELHEMEEADLHHPAHHQGYHLGKHLKRLHGGIFSHKFIEGLMGANEDGDDIHDNDQLKGRGLENETLARLKHIAKQSGIKGYSTMRKRQLIQALHNAGVRGGARTMGKMDYQTQHGYHEKEEDKDAMLHGGIATGAYEGGSWWDDLGAKIKNEFVNPESVLRKKILPEARKVVEPVGNALGSVYGMPDAGSKVDKGLKMVGLGKKKRKPASADDGRRKRSAIVKKVMADEGLSMIDASKYVKAHNLY